MAMILLVAEGSAIGAVRRLRTTWYFFVPGFVPYVASTLFHHVEALRTNHGHQRHKYAALVHYPITVLVPLMVFRQVAQSEIIVRKWAYILKTWGVFVVVTCFAIAVPLYFVPLVRTATTDREKTGVVFTWLLVVSPFVATLTGIVRSLKDGPALQRSPAITFVAFGFALFPRFVQAEMEFIAYQVLSSLIFASFDFVTDLAMPYFVLIGEAARRSLVRFLCRPVRDRHFDTVTAENTQETRDKQTPVMLLSRLSATMMSFKSAGRYSMRSLSTFLDVPTQAVQFGYHPIFLRRLSDQMHAYSLIELTVLIFSNLFNITLRQILFPSVRHLLERLVGLGIMVLIEVFFEGALYIFLVRSANLPLIKSTTEPGVIRMHLLALGIGGTVFIFRNVPVIVLQLLTAADEKKYQSVSTYEFCPFHSSMFELS
ncbi:unnamed protein product [Vitrella brassicaformis CCMP3155]|uniref:Uncharacterized protein n=1 Tax=Vitrella brassicaformis (strain CCMP3155) TaxID=1169540 RepID=A0A0G4GMI4_VITBC|nr:unnamed protein product [Vitrella brassicaformis CCMP3155]|eukprot:CEM31404.1 unnamed protein product [Vitrella brassicaformis CCMP3155]